jgi:hypothetical protein
MTSSLPKTYKALFFDNKGAELTIRDVELKQPGPGYVLVKVVACGVCHSDRFVQQGNFGDVFPRATLQLSTPTTVNNNFINIANFIHIFSTIINNGPH